MQATESFTIRACDRSDAERLSELAARLFTQAYGPTHPEPTLSAYLEESFSVHRMRAELAASGIGMLLVEDTSGHPLGYAYLRESDAPPPVGVPEGRTVEIVRFYVDQAWHGRGVAQALMAGCESEAVRRGARSLWLSVWQEAPRPIAFYRKTGLRIVGTDTFRFGDRLDHDYVMAKPLAPAPSR